MTKNLVEFVDADDDCNGAIVRRIEIKDQDEFYEIMNNLVAHVKKEKKIMFFTEGQKEVIVKALMNDQADGVFDTDKSKQMYEEIFDQLEGKKSADEPTQIDNKETDK